METHECEQCGLVLFVYQEGIEPQDNYVVWEPNAFDEEIHGDMTCYWLCGVSQEDNWMNT